MTERPDRRRWVLCTFRPGKYSRAGDDRGEGRQSRSSREAGRKRLVEDRRPGRDRERVREERRDPGGLQGAASLEPELKRRECEPVETEQDRNQDEADPSRDRSLGGDVAPGVEDAGRESEAGAR